MNDPASGYFLSICDILHALTGYLLIITDSGEPCEYALTITENRRGGTENYMAPLRPSAAPLRPSVVFEGMLF